MSSQSNFQIVRLLTFVAVLLVCQTKAIQDFNDFDQFQDASGISRFQRVARNFPYSLAFQQMLRPASAFIQPISSVQWPRRPESTDIRHLINMIDEEDAQSYGRERRSAGSVYKRYACRFKFCRIFDA